MGKIDRLEQFVAEMRQRLETGRQSSKLDAVDMALYALETWQPLSIDMGPVAPPERPRKTSGGSDKLKAHRWLHGVTWARDLDHQQLSNLLCWGMGIESMKQIEVEMLRKAADFASALSMEELAKKWKDLTPAIQTKLTPLKDYLKGWFERGGKVASNHELSLPLESDICDGSNCGVFILWGITGNGKRVPLDLPELRELSGEGQPEKRYIEDGPGGRVRLADTWPYRGDNEGIEGSVRAYVAHHATCPDAQRFRRNKSFNGATA